MASEEGAKSSNPIEVIRGSFEELKKISRPTRQETLQATMVVIVMLVIISIYLGLLDLVFNRLMNSFLS